MIKPLRRIIICLLALLATGSIETSRGEDLGLLTKGTKSKEVICSASLVRFDGTTLTITAAAGSQVYKAAGTPECSLKSISAQTMEITIALNGAPLNGYDGGYQNNQDPFQAPLNTNRLAASFLTETKDVDAQRAELQEAIQSQRQVGTQSVASEFGNSGQRPANVPLSIDLTKCRGRGSDWIVTSASGTATEVSGRITDISDGWIHLLRSADTQPQRFSLTLVSAIGLGYCSR